MQEQSENNGKILEEYGIMRTENAGGWMGNREFIWSGLIQSCSVQYTLHENIIA